jgi:hypothetical protein
MAQAAEQDGAHVLVAEEVESVIVVEVGRDAGPLSHHLARAKRASHPTAIPNTSRISCRQRAVLCLTHPGQQGFQRLHVCNVEPLARLSRANLAKILSKWIVRELHVVREQPRGGPLLVSIPLAFFASV